MAVKTKAMVTVEPGRMELRDLELPPIGLDDGLLAVEMCGVCGSDPKIFKNASQMYRYPLILGHEVVGRIAAVGSGAAQRWGVSEGDRVVVEFRFACGHCRMCLQGHYRHCDANLAYGGPIPASEPPGLWGGYAQHMYLAPQARIHRVADSLPLEVAVLVCAVLANALRWVRVVGGATIGDTVVIQGAGQQGLAAVVAAREAGAACVIVLGLARDEERFALARKLGAHYTVAVDREDPVAVVRAATGGTMADLVIDVTGAPDAAAVSLNLVRRMGTIVNAGTTSAVAPVPFDTQRIVRWEITYRGAYTHDTASVIPALRLAESGKYPLGSFITHRLGLAQAEHALRVVEGAIPEEYPIKAVLLPTL